MSHAPMMFRSLRWRLLLAFGLLILLTVLLTGGLASVMTANRFDLFVTEQGKAQARQIAPLLEASYLLHGSWQGVDQLWHAVPPPSQTRTLSVTEPHTLADHPVWRSEVDWLQVIADELNLDPNILWAEYGSSTNLAAIVTQHGKRLDDVIAVVYAAEKAAADAAMTAGTLTEKDAQAYLANQSDDIRAYLIRSGYGTSVDWNAISASHFAMSKADFLQALAGHTIAELAVEKGVDLQALRQAILQAEVIALYHNPRFGEADAVTLLSSAVDWLDQYLGVVPTARAPDANAASDDDPNRPTGLLADFLYGGEHLLIISPEGHFLYDTTGKHQGTQVPQQMLADGVPLHKLPTGEQIATLLVATGSGSYSQQQRMFLRGVLYSLLLSSLIAVGVALLAAVLLARQVTAPVAALTAAAQQIASGYTDARLPVTTNDELGQMSTTFNQMVTTLATQRELRQRLINDLSHELGTPLSVIQLEMQALRDGLQTPSQAFAQVQGEIELLRNLINDLGHLEETENGQLSLQREPIDLLVLAERAVKRWQAKAERKGVTLVLATGDDLLPLIDADAARLTQVMGNLLDNALRHSARGGAITVSCRVATLRSLTPPVSETLPSGPPPDLGLIVTVGDTGSGIPAADLPHVFERFYRVDSSRNRRSGGRGLGLSIVQQIITAHDGYVWAQSVEGQGSTFGFYLPIIEIE